MLRSLFPFFLISKFACLCITFAPCPLDLYICLQCCQGLTERCFITCHFCHVAWQRGATLEWTSACWKSSVSPYLNLSWYSLIFVM